MTAPATTTPAWRSRIVGSAEVPPDTLVPNAKNWRRHPKAQQEAIAGALDQVGWVQQVLVNRRTGRMIDGHARVEQALLRGEAAVPVLYVDLDDHEEALVLATLDPIGAMAETNDQALRELLADVRFDAPSLEAVVLDLLPVAPRAGRTDPDDVPETPAEPYVKPGDLLALGEHRLLCGDSTDGPTMLRLMDGGASADLLWTDPPYGVAYQTKLSRDEAVARHRRMDGREIENDAQTTDQLRSFLNAAFRNAAQVMRRGAAYYVACPEGSSDTGDVHVPFRLALAEAGLPIRETLVWVKDVFVMGRQDYHWRHEPILYGWKPGAAHHFVDDRTQDTVWEVARPKRSAEHPTMKPVELVARAIANSSRPGNLVLDPFAGSGTTLIAAEQLGRACRTIELDPRYAQVVIERWQEFTGHLAERLQPGVAS